jgi:predicted GNAT family acetyltransferase
MIKVEKQANNHLEMKRVGHQDFCRYVQVLDKGEQAFFKFSGDSGDYRLLIENGRQIGGAVINHRYSPDTILVVNTVVNPDLRQKGYGKKIIELLAEEAKRESKRLLALTFNDDRTVKIFGKQGLGFGIIDTIEEDGEVLWEYPLDR